MLIVLESLLTKKIVLFWHDSLIEFLEGTRFWCATKTKKIVRFYLHAREELGWRINWAISLEHWLDNEPMEGEMSIKCLVLIFYYQSIFTIKITFIEKC